MSYNAKFHSDGPNKRVIESGGELEVKSGGKITAAGTQAAHIADIATDASGTEIATAVNAILAALEGVGVTASS